MSYDVIKRDFSKEKFAVVEIDVEYCSNDFGVSPCTASGSGDSKCYNCRSTCQDLPNFDAEIKTVRHCTNRSPHAIGVNAVPDIKDITVSPSKIDLKGGLGVRSSVTISFADHPSSDISLDKYVDERSYNPLDRSLYWLKLRSRWPNYQNNGLRVYIGYLDQGVFRAENFEPHYFIIDKLDASQGMATLTGKDPLKLASKDKAQAPVTSTGKLQADLLIGETTATLTPSGVGNLEYPASGKVLVRSEVMMFTRSNDVLTLIRGQNNTPEEEHSSEDTVQLCLEYNSEQVNDIVYDLLVNYAGINPSYINQPAWQAEIDTFISGLISATIVNPVDVNTLLMELSQAMPHYLWWNEKTQLIELTALKAPDSGQQTLTMDENIIQGSFKTTDKKELRKSTVVVNYGQFNPTKKIDEADNYQSSYIRADGESIASYGSNEIQTINTRWITNTNEAAARQLAALIGRRFSNIPREVSFSLEDKDSDIWIGQTVALNHRDVVDASGSPVDTVYQLTSASEKKSLQYVGLEFTYGESLPEDEGGGEPGVDIEFIPNEAVDINLRTLFDGNNPPPDATTIVKFILDSGRVCGSSSNADYAINTGSWPAGALVTLQINPSATGAGIGGSGATVDGVGATDGGDFLILNHDLELINNGVIGGGGGGGGRVDNIGSASGGGGAGFYNGMGGGGNRAPIGATIITNNPASNGSIDSGGNGGELLFNQSGEPFFLEGGVGGNLGQPGETKTTTGGQAGVAINKNGYTLTETELGDVRGLIIG